MIAKQHVLQNKNLPSTKEGNHNAKVTVQYIQNPELYQKRGIHQINNDLNTVRTDHQEDIEIENVEYLEENTNVEEYIEDPCGKEFEDNFYPNAIHCLLDLYKTKYEILTDKNESDEVAHLWRDIAKDMQESFFEFNEYQLQQKYASLRAQYFALQTKDDIENFDYFEQLHDIYKDLSRENIAKGFTSANASLVYYKDEIFVQAEHLESSGEHLHDFKSEEIVHKEHEFIDMVEKELQAMEDGIHAENKETLDQKGKLGGVSNSLKNVESAKKQKTQNVKRVRLNTECEEEPPHSRTKIRECFQIDGIMEKVCYSNAKPLGEFSLYLYNQEQERRHREKMAMIERSLKIQERALNQQQQLLQELIKRAPS